MAAATRSRLRTLAKLSPSECIELAQAQLELVAAQFLVSTRPTGTLVAPATPDASSPSTHAVPDPRVERLALAVSRAADHGVFRPRCLVRALATTRMLERRGIVGSRIRIGVRVRPGGGGFIAHAWVEYAGRVIGDRDAHVDSFTELTDMRLADSK
jgi:hypothetical protein